MKKIAQVNVFRADDGKYLALISHHDARAPIVSSEGLGDFDTLGSLLTAVTQSVLDGLRARPPEHVEPAVLPAPEPIEHAS